MITKLLLRLIEKHVLTRPYDVLVDEDYMRRWYIIPRNRFFNIYFHLFFGSDADTPHDHPWVSMSWILRGSYIEHTPQGDYVRKTGDITLRGPRALHWIEIDRPVYTLFLTGPRVRVWGFQCREKWYSHTDYIAARGPDRLANGCGESQ